eukprot:GFYU01054707.1.p1 GENE.GFYU01054707.1~~GFYU01054707.1.p1  ORF type:complete len:117 (-),score=31.92 GFYU01054707.1:217-525(-)
MFVVIIAITVQAHARPYEKDLMDSLVISLNVSLAGMLFFGLLFYTKILDPPSETAIVIAAFLLLFGIVLVCGYVIVTFVRAIISGEDVSSDEADDDTYQESD